MRFSLWALIGLGLVFVGACLTAQTGRGLSAFGQGEGLQWEALEVRASTATGFRPVESSLSGIQFTNHLSDQSAELNRILENGSGVAAGDIDGDGWVDLYFCRLEGPNVLYRNLGGFRFEDVTSSAGVPCDGQASTGAVLVDIDGDSDVDLFVNGVGAGTRCFLNDGKGAFTEATEVGLDRRAGSMSMALADADQDGDLDLYVANYQTMTWKDFPPGVKPRVKRVGGNPIAEPQDRFVASLRANGSTAITEIGQPDAFYLNDGRGRFELVDWLGGRFLDEDGVPLKAPPRHWGLSVAFRDFNGDRLPDLYVCNDFLYGNDDFFLNIGKGVFRRIDRAAIRHSSWSAMAVDVADIDRDGDFDFMVVDMLSQDQTRRLTQRANYETGSKLREVGLILDRPQQQHNSLYLNRGDGTFAEIAHLAGVEASEWSWSVAFLDVDLDGYEDLLVGNGHAHDLLDGDVTMEAMHVIRSAPRGSAPRTLLMYPRLDLPDVAFRNRGDLTFEDVSDAWGFDLVGVSSALCRADLDRDGDWDVIVNRLQGEAAVLENVGGAPRIAVTLDGNINNHSGAGALVRLVPKNGSDYPVQQQEVVVGGRYLSSDEPGVVFAAGEGDRRFRLEVEWAGGKQSVIEQVRANRRYRVSEDAASEKKPHETSPLASPWFEEATSFLEHQHVDRWFNDLTRQPLLPRLMSQLGPGVNWADVNRDGFIDLILPSGATGRMEVWMNRQGKGFRWLDSEPLEVDQSGGLWMNVIGDEFRFVVGMSNYESGQRSQSAVTLYEIDDREISTSDALPGQQATVGAVVSLDYDSDGDLDVFVGGRVNPGRYPEPAISRIYRNDGGRFHLDLETSRSFVDVGLVSGAIACDLDGDGDSDLALAMEWGPVAVWLNERGRFVDATQRFGLDKYLGWWTSVAVGDFNEDGRLDLVAGNWGRNSKYERYREHPIRLAYGDIDRNGMVETFERVYDEGTGRWSTIRDLIIMGIAVPSLQQRTHSYRDFATMGLEGAFGSVIEALPEVAANWLEATVFLNQGEEFLAKTLPKVAQMAPSFGLVVGDFNADGHDDLFMAQNFFATQPETPRYDAGLGLLLAGQGDGTFEPIVAGQSGIRLLGEQRGAASADMDRDGRLDLVVTQNGSATRLFRNTHEKAGHTVRLEGPPGNRQAVGTELRLGGGEGRGPLRVICGGAGYWSQNSGVTVWPASESDQHLEVQWFDGKRSELVLRGDAKEWQVMYPAE